MINKDNFKNLLKALNFKQKEQIFSKDFPEINGYLKVDFAKNLLIYPKDKGLKIDGEFTCNFDANENFVVFECVNRLFEKGYKPENLTLEPKWKVGHGASGGRADILVKDNSGKSLLIIECKTEGSEFKKEWNNTLQRGGQLFSYSKQAGSTQYICLYASDFINEKVVYFSNIISLNDNKKLLEELADKKPLSFKEAKGLAVEDIYKAWKETYNLDFATKGIFEEDILPYQIGKEKYSIDDLAEISEKDIQGKYHQFATIMRKYNVSGRENAFDKLVNLFLCKIVDEAKNPKDLKFNWKGIAYDNDFDLIDRLQTLYQTGMKEFLGEDVANVSKKEIVNAFKYVKQDPDATKDAVLKFFRELKYFKNSDFSFIDVHNEKLFYQNARILLEIVKMLQDTKLQSENQNQFLGDMFEGFLDNGVKQSEGQFFTPMPIVKFILNSLPLENIIKKSELPPKAIDYACGAGHFLNELALQIKPFVEKHKKTNIKEYYQEIVGIEKEYRLSKVAKVSAFMYGQNDIKIIYADALGNNNQLKENDYSILVANPPYSVKGFLQTLSEAERKAFTLLNVLDEKSIDNNNSIETFFIERAKQLLKPGAVAAIILPSSILSNDSSLYTATREIILKYFQIIAIADLGKFFGKTATRTVTIFLRKKDENPSPADHFKSRVDDWFSGNQATKIYDDNHIINSYCHHIKINEEHYKTLLAGKPSDELLTTEMFVDYKKAFENLSEIKNLKKPNSTFGKKPQPEQQIELEKRFTAYLQAIEKDKIYFYALAYENKQKILVVNAPSDDKEQKKFLGFEWSSAKGNEGIKYLNQENGANAGSNVGLGLSNGANGADIEIEDLEIKEMVSKLKGLHHINTALYNPNNRNDKSKINHYIEQNFLGNELLIDESPKGFIGYHQTVDLLDFSRVNFNKAISLNAKKKSEVESKWELVKLGDVKGIEFINGFAFKSEEFKNQKQNNIDLPVLKIGNIKNGSTSFEGDLQFHSAKNIEKKIVENGDLVIALTGATVGKSGFVKEKSLLNQRVLALRGDSIAFKYSSIFILSDLFYDYAQSFAHGNAQGNLSPDQVKNFKIPLPPLETQQKIVAECTAIDNQAEVANGKIARAKAEIEDRIRKILNENFIQEKISNIAILNPSKSEIKDISDETLVSFIEMASVSEKGLIVNKVDKTLKDLKKGSYTYFRDNDIIIAKITPCMENGKCALAQGLKNAIGMGSSEFHVVRAKKDINIKFLFFFLNREEIRKEAEKNMTGSSGHRRVPSSYYENLKIPLPPLETQQKIVAEIEKLEQEIKVNQALIDGSLSEKKSIMKKYL